MPDTTSILGFADSMLARWRRHRADMRTRRAIDSLSHHMRKDIGWPDPLPDRVQRRWPAGENRP